MKDFTEQIKQFFSKSEKEILNYLMQWWEIEGTFDNGIIPLIGIYEKANRLDKNGKEYGFFTNVRSLKGDILYYPFRLGQVGIYSIHNEDYQNTKFLKIEVLLSKQPFREKSKNPFALTVNKVLGDTPLEFLDRIDKEKFIKQIFNETGYTLRDAKNTSNALKKIAGDLYTETERFIFELLQNADDIPNERKEVDVKFILLSENLLFLHNGKPFDKNDVNSIASIGDSTKRKDAEKTGYKGIGFKSVFTDSETVLINSGNFSFSFDKQSPLYKGQNIDEIPWEIKPIWTEHYRYPKEVKDCEDFFKLPVAINLEVGNLKIRNYRNQIQKLFSEPRFILFLRHVKTIEVQGLVKDIKIQKVSKNDKYELLNNDIPVSEWIIENFEFSLTQEIRDAMADDKIVPEKLKEIQKSKLSFACQIKESKIIRMERNQSYLFTYLPTNVNDYEFPFLVNADFLTTANRQSIHVKNIWNLYLFEQIGYLCFTWISQISQNEELKNSVLNLIPSRFNNSTEQLHQSFNKGFDKAIQEIEFLPTSTGILCKVADALVDVTGLSEVIGYDLFIKVTNPNKQLINNNLENKKNLKNLGVQAFDITALKQVFSNKAFQQVLTPEILLDVLVFLQKNNSGFSDVAFLLSEKSDKDLYNPSSLYFQANQEDKKLLNFKTEYFLHPTINKFAEQNSKFKNWLSNLGVKNFEGANYIKEEIIGQHNVLNKVLTDISININFWRFIFNYRNSLLESDLKKLANFYVIDVLKKTCIFVCNCYLSDFYKSKSEPSTESIFSELGLEGYFLMQNYCSEQKDIPEWRKFFNKIGLKRSENTQIFKNSLVPFIQNTKMSGENYLKVTKFIFEIFIENRTIFEDFDLSSFQVYTTDNKLQPVSDCILSDDYTQDLRLSGILPEFSLPDQIHSIYLQQINNNRQTWKEFFLRLNPNAELNSIEIIKKKVSIIANESSSVTTQNVSVIWKKILEFKEELLKTHREELKKIPLLLKNETLVVPTLCYFSKEYSPSTQIEDLLTGYYDYFISPSFNSISSLSYAELKIFFKQIGVDEEIKRTNLGNNNFDICHKEHLSKFDFAKRFWAYFQKNFSIFTTNINTKFKTYLQSNASIPCLDNTLKTPNIVHSHKLKDLANDRSVTCCIDFSEPIESFIGLQQKLTIPKCFQLLNEIASIGDSEDKRIKRIYDHLLHRFTNEHTISPDITNFQQNGKLLSNRGTFQNVRNLFYQDITANYLPLDKTDKIIKRLGSREDWKKFEEQVLTVLGLQKITVSDFTLDSQSFKHEAFELNQTIQNSLPEFAKKIDTINFQTIENQLQNKFKNINIYDSPNLKLSCSKLNYSPVVPNYYDDRQNTIYYSGNWNSISNAKLIEYLFKAFDILESEISKDEFVSILLKNIPVKNNVLPDDVVSPAEMGVDVRSIGDWGENLVYSDLVSKFGKDRICWLNECGESFKNHDFEILAENKKEVIYYIDAKATMTGEISGDTVPIYIRKSEWNFMQECQDNYIIARVYNAKSSNAYIKYLKLGIASLPNNLQ